MTEWEEFRFVTKDGRSTPWKPLPKDGIQKELHKAVGTLGQSVDLQMRKKSNVHVGIEKPPSSDADGMGRSGDKPQRSEV
jgi:hypothetical protein